MRAWTSPLCGPSPAACNVTCNAAPGARHRCGTSTIRSTSCTRAGDRRTGGERRGWSVAPHHVVGLLQDLLLTDASPDLLFGHPVDQRLHPGPLGLGQHLARFL